MNLILIFSKNSSKNKEKPLFSYSRESIDFSNNLKEKFSNKKNSLLFPEKLSLNKINKTKNTYKSLDNFNFLNQKNKETNFNEKESQLMAKMNKKQSIIKLNNLLKWN